MNIPPSRHRTLMMDKKKLRAKRILYLFKVYLSMLILKSFSFLSIITDVTQKLYMNVKRLHQARFEKLNPCQMFYVDAALPLQVIALLANYTFVVLQFAFL